MQHSATPNQHAEYVFETYVEPHVAYSRDGQSYSSSHTLSGVPAPLIRNIAIVAHSAGGSVTTYLVRCVVLVSSTLITLWPDRSDLIQSDPIYSRLQIRLSRAIAYKCFSAQILFVFVIVQFNSFHAFTFSNVQARRFPRLFLENVRCIAFSDACYSHNDVDSALWERLCHVCWSTNLSESHCHLYRVKSTSTLIITNTRLVHVL